MTTDPKRLNSREIAARLGVTRDAAEALLVRLALRGPGDDGSTEYDFAEVQRRLDTEDKTFVRGLADLFDPIANPELARRAIAEAFEGLKANCVT